MRGMFSLVIALQGRKFSPADSCMHVTRAIRQVRAQ